VPYGLLAFQPLQNDRIAMEMDRAHRAKTGAFYTPEEWCRCAWELMEVYCVDLLYSDKEYALYDPAYGEGALLYAIPDYHRGFRMGTTLEIEDVCSAFEKKDHRVYQLDFLQDAPLPEWLLRWAKGSIVFPNPPYFQTPKGVADALVDKYGTREACCLFLARLIDEIHPAFIGTFHKGFWQGRTYQKFLKKTRLWERFIDGFGTPSFTWPHLKGNFPIYFSIFDCREDALLQSSAPQSITYSMFSSPPKEGDFIHSHFLTSIDNRL